MHTRSALCVLPLLQYLSECRIHMQYPGLPSIIPRSHRRSLQPQVHVHWWMRCPGNTGVGLWLRARYVPLSRYRSHTNSSQSSSDEITLDVLRGIQGIGAAACIPAAVSSSLSLPPTRTNNGTSARHPRAQLPSFSPSFYRFCDFCSRRPCGWCDRLRHWGHSDTIHRVRLPNPHAATTPPDCATGKHGDLPSGSSQG